MNARDPFQGFRYIVEIEGLTVGGFTRVKGLSREVKIEVFREGGVNDFEYKLASLASFGNLVLERGFATTGLWDWHEEVVGGKIRRRKITVALRDERQNELWRVHADAAFPVKWTLSDFDAASAQVIVESVEFAHHGLRQS
jgi:phage tail-like protein